MADSITKTKKAHFHRAYMLQNGARAEGRQVEWQTLLAGLAGKSLADRTILDVIFEPVQAGGQWALGIHKPLNPDFMSTIDHKSGSVTDLMTDDDDESKAFAHSTAVAFLPSGNTFAVALGTSSSPRAGQIARLLDVFTEQDQDGSFWKTEPLVDDDQIRELKDSAGLVSFASKFSTKRNLFTPDGTESGPVAMAEKFAASLGGDIEVKIEVTLSKAARSKTIKQKLKDLFVRDLERLTGKDSKATAVAMISDGVEQELSLVEHNLAADFDITLGATESQRFSHLVDALVNVSGEMQSRVKQILEG